MSRKSSSSSSLQTWCSDALHDLLGFTDAALASYLVHVGKTAKSVDAILTVLQEATTSDSTNTDVARKRQAFAEELFQRSHGGSGSHAAPKAQSGASTSKTQADWMKDAKSYELLADADDDDDVKDEATSSSKRDRSKRESKKKRRQDPVDDDKSSKDAAAPATTEKASSRKKRHRRTRTSDSSDEEEEDGNGTGMEGVRAKIEERHERRRQEKYSSSHPDQEQESQQPDSSLSTSALTAEERAELERQQDMKERDELVQRMRNRDQSKTKSEGDTGDQEEQMRKEDEARLVRGETVVDKATGQELSLEKLREQSRSAYLKKREERELTLLKQSLEDEDELFRDAKLTEAEKKRIAFGKQILGMVGERKEDEDKNDGFYRLPDEFNENDTKANQDKALLSSRYTETKKEKSEQELWEESQTQKASGLGSRKKKPSKADEYDLVFDDQIDFVMQESNKGYDRRDKKHRVKEEEEEQRKDDPLEPRPATAHEKMLAGRKKLPVYAYREELLAAVKDHQVLILVGETGSGT
jgi:pre-mRNA-splicing factor ATP-dependent RNA helicase DHX16